MPPPTTIHHHPLPAKIYPPPLTTTHRRPPPPTTIQNISTITYHKPKYTHQHLPPPTDSQNVFYKKPIYENPQLLSDGNVRNLNSRSAIAKKPFFTWSSPSFLLHTPEMVLKSYSVNEPLYYAKLV